MKGFYCMSYVFICYSVDSVLPGRSSCMYVLRSTFWDHRRSVARRTDIGPGVVEFSRGGAWGQGSRGLPSLSCPLSYQTPQTFIFT